MIIRCFVVFQREWGRKKKRKKQWAGGESTSLFKQHDNIPEHDGDLRGNVANEQGENNEIIMVIVVWRSRRII